MIAKSFVFALLIGSAVAAWGFRYSPPDVFDGRWDLTLNAEGQTYPSWIEVRGARDGPTVRLVGRTGSVHAAEQVKLDGYTLTFQSGADVWTLTEKDGRLSGTNKHRDTVAQVTGVRAPLLDRKAPAAWSKPEPIFNGKDLTGWTPDHPEKNHWKVQDGALLNAAPGANLRTDRQFTDFKLHIEFNCPQGGNSGIYLRGRYELQVEYEPAGTDDQFHSIGSIYGFLAPSVQVQPQPGSWETFEVTLVGRTVTVRRDGETTISEQEIPGITGGAINSHEDEPGPIYLQGDHTGGMKYRNITISAPQ